MNRTLLFLISIMAALYACAESVAPYKGPRLFWDTTTRTTVFNTGGYSRIIQLNDGRLMAACEHSGIDIAYSNNMGGTWSSPQKLVTNPAGISECVPDLIQLRDGTIIVAYNPRPSAPYSEERKFGIRCKYSTDNGATWSSEIFINDAKHTFDNGCWEPSMLELPSGELQLYFADEGPYTSTGEQQISLCRSFDKGKTWTAPQKVSFRAGWRDGMPVPILLQDNTEIVFVFEDNGWGYGGAFFPTTARCTLDNNWNNFWVGADSPNRERTLDFDYCPVATGGAPYLRQLPGGETVISYQSDWNSATGKLTMLVAVGDEKARHFKALSHPFVISGSTTVQWNSLAVVDTGVVVAVGGVDSRIEMIKGYPKKQFECAWGSPAVDGLITRGEGYHAANAAQIRIGNETGTLTTCDYAYDNDSLYFIARIADREPMPTGAYADGLRLFIETAGASDTKPQTTTYQYYARLNGSITRMVGTGHAYKTSATEAPHLAVTQKSSYYIVELAIPWSDMGLSAAPSGQNLRTNIEIRNGNTSGIVTESIPDARANEPWTWMPLHLADRPEDTALPTIEQQESGVEIETYGNKFSIHSFAPVKTALLYDQNGRFVASFHRIGQTFSATAPMKGVAIIKLLFENGDSTTRKIVF